MLGRYLRRRSAKKIDCFFCHKTIKKKETWGFDIDTADGMLKKAICEDCANDLQEMKIGASVRKLHE